MPYRIAAEAQAALRTMPPEGKKRLRAALALLGEGRRRGLDSKRLEPPERHPALYRLRIGSWRAVYRQDGSTILLLRVFPRSDGYGWLERMDRR